MDGRHLDSCEEDGEQRRGIRLFRELRERVSERKRTLNRREQEGARSRDKGWEKM